MQFLKELDCLFSLNGNEFQDWADSEKSFLWGLHCNPNSKYVLISYWVIQRFMILNYASEIHS